MSLINIIRPKSHDGFVLFSDMDGFQAPHGGTIPPNVLVTNLKPDLFIFNEDARLAILFELTCPWDANIEKSHDYKEKKYSSLLLLLICPKILPFYSFPLKFPFVVNYRGQTRPD